MLNTPPTKPYGGMYEKVREYYIEREALLGMIKWQEVVRTDHFENDTKLFVKTLKTPKRVFINGDEYVPFTVN